MVKQPTENILSIIQPKEIKKSQDQYRYYICNYYDVCLDWAAKKDICFTCKDCPLFKREPNKQNFLVRAAQSPRVKHKCKKCGHVFYSTAEAPKCPECLRKRREELGKMRRCKQCGYVWVSRVEKPIRCPSCKSRRWNKKPKNLNKVVGANERAEEKRHY